MKSRNAWLWIAGALSSGCAADASQDAELAAYVIAAEELDGAAADAPNDRPVVLVAGLLQDANTLAPLADSLRELGHDVTLFVPPALGFDDIYGYADLLAVTVEEVRRTTGATEVDLIGHSEGGVTARRYIKDQTEGAPVHTLVSLGSPQQGTEGGLLSQLLRATLCESWAPACEQMVAGSDFLAELNGGDPTPGDVRYVTIGSRYDGVVQPVTRAGIFGAENLVVQDICPERTVGHFGLFEDAWVHQVVGAVLAGGAATGDCSALPVGSLL